LVFVLVLAVFALADSGQVGSAARNPNSAPTASDQSVSTSQDTRQEITLFARDRDGDRLSYVIIDEPLRGTLSGSGPSYLYTASPGYVGSDSFRWRTTDGTKLSGVATTSIEVMSAESSSPTMSAAPSEGEQSAAPEGSSAPICVQVSESCPGDSLVAAGELDQFPGTVLEFFEPDGGDDESGPICVEVSESCPGDSLVAAGELDEFPDRMVDLVSLLLAATE
jgi:hypothetical protein